MSDINLARRTEVLLSINGVDISEDLADYLLSLTYTDEEEDKTDDLSVQIADRDGIWRKCWLNSDVSSAHSSTASAFSVGTKVMVKQGAKDYNGVQLQSWVYSYEGFTVIEVSKSNPDRVVFGIDGVVTAAIHADNLLIDGGAAATASNGNSASGFAVGDSVMMKQGAKDYNGTILQSWVYSYEGFTVIEVGKINTDRIVVGINGVVTAAMRAEDLYRSGSSARATTSANGLKGASVTASILQKNPNSDGKDKLLECGTFQIDTIGLGGPPSIITLKMTSLPFTSTLRYGTRNKAWENIRLSAIAEKIAASAKMKCYFSSAYDPLYKRREQAGVSDIAFLQRLCKAAGIALKVTANAIVCFDEAEYEAKDAVHTFTYGGGEIINHKFTDSVSDTTYSSCHVSYTNPDTGAVIEYTYTPRNSDGSGQILEINEKVEDREEASQLAMKRLRQKNKSEFSASLSVYGNPDLVAGCNVNVEGFGSFDGKYIIETAVHTVSSSGYTTKLQMHKCLEGY